MWRSIGGASRPPALHLPCTAACIVHPHPARGRTRSSAPARTNAFGGSALAVTAARPIATTRQLASLVYTQKIPQKKSSFRDRVRIYVSGGRGGAGCSSYDTDPYGRGGPDGANGGRGGDVYLVSTDQLATFTMETFHLRGQNGQAGGSKLAKGRNGYSLKVPIPAGTVVSEILATDPQKGEYTLQLLADMDRPGLELQVARGGAGGLGNRAFKTEYRKQARFSTVGQAGTWRWLHLELKCIADVGLVGYPNAGKSSFLAAISNATPEIANYPFTTLHPQVGVVELAEFSSADPNSPPPLASTAMSRIRVADLPGLISGASRENRGLGHEFLKHIQRTSVLCYVVDLSANDDRDPVEDFRSLQQELQHFDDTLLRKPAIVIANKVDNVAKRRKAWMAAKLEELQSITPIPIFQASCLKRTGLDQIVAALGDMVRVRQEAEREERMAAIHEQQERDAELAQERKQEEQNMLEQARNDMTLQRGEDREQPANDQSVPTSRKKGVRKAKKSKADSE